MDITYIDLFTKGVHKVVVLNEGILIEVYEALSPLKNRLQLSYQLT